MTWPVRLALVIAVGTVAGFAPAARAEPPTSVRRTHWAIGVGGFGSLEGIADSGPAAEIEIYPGSFGRWGARAAAQGLGSSLEGALITAGPTYTAGAARPRLHLALHPDLAVTVEEPGGTRIGIGGGLQTQLWLTGPIAVGLDTTGHVLYRAGDLSLHLSTAITLRLSM